MTDPEIHHLTVPGAELVYDVRPSATPSAAPTLLLIGSPMGAAGFGTLAGHFPDRTVVTYDPRGAERSRRTDGAATSTPEEHADDLHRIIAAVGGPVDVFASSGGAVNAVALVAEHPDDVRTLVAHEPPLASMVPDREQALAATEGIHRLFLDEGVGPAMVRFILLVSHTGPVPVDFLGAPAPSPAEFGLPAEDDGSRDDVLLGQNLVSCTHHAPDVDAIRSASSRVVVAVGEESEGQLASRAAYALADALGVAPTVFPGGHAGFLGGEYGETGQPDDFAKALREVLDGQA
ncbi:alpha/beta fold hydrolase [Mumia zhuanghuii]|uniref:Alpha/beta hydrolase n=1 Tax=Mumia zhuanghuii TaxID=2585211 RepID=A0A5C4MJ51_9ACTN|nr:alpha/beta hydrolase [Mumia zhuanghuii]TNC42746.1 alpha/beta hydrolase [Mumia zhuanghuii]TNC42816.1 alpha/beta hydrolase [Mumia zhuanghuii]